MTEAVPVTETAVGYDVILVTTDGQESTVRCEPGSTVLAAAEQGLGTCWIGWFSQKGAAKALGLGSGRKVEVLLSVGYPAENPAPRPRKSKEEYSSYNKL